MHEESVEEIEKDNEQIQKEVREEEEMRWQLSKKSEWKVNNIVWESSCSQHWCCIISVKSLQEIQD